MNYEEKYKQALKVIESLYNIVRFQSSSDALLTCQTIEKAFPELLESEDDRIRKEIYRYFRDLQLSSDREFSPSTSIDEILSWLEKQGEQKPIEQDTETHDLWVYIREWNDKFGRLPKDEDELASCIDYVMKRQKAAWSEKHIADVFEKVGLAKIVREQGNDQLTNAVQSAMIELSKQQNPACSEEDRKHIDNIISLLNQTKERFVRESGQFPSWITEIIWLESIKDRIQPQQEWSEEDEQNLNFWLDNNKSIDSDKRNWLKSLKERYTWKPSEEQMIALRWVLNNIPYNKHKEVISQMVEQLKKL